MGSGGGRSTLVGLLILGAIIVLFGWVLPEQHVIDYQQDLWSKPGRVTAVAAAFVVAFIVAAAMARHGGIKTVPLLLVLIVVGVGAYSTGLYGRTAGADLKCKKGYAVTLDGVCEKAPKAAPKVAAK